MNDDHPPSKRANSLLKSLLAFFHKKVSKADLRKYLQEAKENNIIDTEEAAMMAGVLSVSEQRVRDVMLPKSKMVTVAIDMSFNETIKLVIESGHSRFPVAADENIIGILMAKDLLNYVLSSSENFSISSIMRSVRYIPESKPLDILLREFRHQRIHMVIVTNEYGDVSGLATIEDVLEEIVGEIDDEHDDNSNTDIVQINNNCYVVSALTTIDDFNQSFEMALDKESSDTIGGFVLSHFGYVPKKGESMNFAELKFTINDADDRRILKILIEK